MDFYIRLNKYLVTQIRQEFVTDIFQTDLKAGILYIEKLSHLDYQVEGHNRKTWCFGDVIKFDPKNYLASKGFFYTIIYDHDRRRLEFISDYHSFLPLYYSDQDGEVIISSSVDLIARDLKHKTHNPQFVTDIALFNVPLGVECFFREIKRVSYGKKLMFNRSGLQIIGDQRVYQSFVVSPVPYRKALKGIVELFIQNCADYLNQPAYVSLTGGFDSRTVASLAHYYQIDYKCFTHGKLSSSDVQVPIRLADALGFKHIFLELADDYVEQNYVRFVREYLRLSGGMNGFLYPHFLYDIFILANDPRPVVTGFCGSELLRNSHFGGAVSSQVVLDILSVGRDYAIKKLEGNPDLSVLGKDYMYKEYLNYGVNFLVKYLREIPPKLSENQKLVVFEFEEVLPKLFGTIVYAGMHYNRVRVPFMDIEFYTAILKTDISQVYRRFMEQNPLKRFWGQYLYAMIIDIAWPNIGRLKSNKGYAPSDLLSVLGKIRIIRGYLRKKKRLASADYDSLGIVSGLTNYLKIESNIADKDIILNDIDKLHANEHRRDMVCLRLSAAEYMKMSNVIDNN